MTAILWHTVAAVVALLSGALTLLLKKGTRVHRRLGRVYVGAMLSMCIVSLFIHEVNGGVSAFHAVTIQALGFVAAGFAMPLLCRTSVPRWRVWHDRLMLYSYITQVCTGIAQGLDHLPFSRPVAVVLFVQTPAIVGWYLTEFRLLRTLQPRAARVSDSPGRQPTSDS